MKSKVISLKIDVMHLIYLDLLSRKDRILRGINLFKNFDSFFQPWKWGNSKDSRKEG